MRTLFVGLLAGTVAIMTGCTKGPDGGNLKADSFEVKAPALTTALKPGESKTVKLTVERGKEFKQTVKLAADAPKTGIKVELLRSELKAGDPGEIEMKLTAEEQASPGEAKVTLKATPEKGDAKSVDVKVSVEEGKKAGS
jgi:uncharacterized membrane protein